MALWLGAPVDGRSRCAARGDHPLQSAETLADAISIEARACDLARLSEANGEFRLVIGGGEMLKAPRLQRHKRYNTLDSGAAAVMDIIMREGLEHHISLTYGDHQDVLESLARMLGLPVLRL